MTAPKRNLFGRLESAIRIIEDGGPGPTSRAEVLATMRAAQQVVLHAERLADHHLKLDVMRHQAPELARRLRRAVRA